MISAEITLVDGTKKVAYERTWEELFEKIRELDIKHMAAAVVRVQDMRHGKQRGEARL